ncbi:hypothetical protein JAAARDRAFT_47391 [Jaapia argillacea MUCL 33604]|uniref:Uncharacterized protein n=1 Tax=Jaapia argillacea MUCL 33604 TaxID=933084 RepID=A0A067Q472_9AGAM|nr:hypothetical protein JAAARDRAFT_47391 [Jaapia argillacea MUCL 33604]
MPPRRKTIAIPSPEFPENLSDTPYNSDCNVLYTTVQMDDPGFVAIMEYLDLVVKEPFRFRACHKYKDSLIPSLYVPHICYVNHVHTYGLLWHHLHKDWESVSTSGWDKLSMYFTKVMQQFLAMAVKAYSSDQMSTKWRCSFFNKFLTREFFGVPHIPAMADAELKKDRIHQIDLGADPFTLDWGHFALLDCTHYSRLKNATRDMKFTCQSDRIKYVKIVQRFIEEDRERHAPPPPKSSKKKSGRVAKHKSVEEAEVLGGDDVVEEQMAGAKKHGRSMGKGKAKAKKEISEDEVDEEPPAEPSDNEVIDFKPAKKKGSRSQKVDVKQILSDPTLLTLESGDESIDNLTDQRNTAAKFTIRLPAKKPTLSNTQSEAKKVEPTPSGSGEPSTSTIQWTDQELDVPSTTTRPDIALTPEISQHSSPSTTPPADSLMPSYYSPSTGNPNESMDDEGPTFKKLIDLANIQNSGEGDELDELDEDANIPLDRPYIQLFTQQNNESSDLKEASNMEISPVAHSKKPQIVDARIQPLKGIDPGMHRCQS